MHEVRHVKLFRLSGDLVVEIPEGWEFPEGDVEMWKDGDALVIRPARQEEQPSGSIDAPPRRP
jgi:virulence-associated protein VagC